jgi:hypothetical protein
MLEIVLLVAICFGLQELVVLTVGIGLGRFRPAPIGLGLLVAASAAGLYLASEAFTYGAARMPTPVEGTTILLGLAVGHIYAFRHADRSIAGAGPA